ncbi:hypothetical protein EW026_g7492 [Hermanssonia centrifuga]|uniref:DUF6533 domain-containing protein n=1 Tax=Hermanssonia centrifuga TaxID=98765 RepID=A0A4S4K8Q9_9APHY|nr:hypothetical protein EW026_g7492 [Hermanssonia centrifuga]
MDVSLTNEIAASIHTLVALKYIAGAGLALALWDHIITLRHEVEVVWNWKARRLAQLVYLLHRYGLGIGLIYIAYIQSGLHGDIDLKK